MKGYKVFNSDWTCRDFQYKVGETYEMNEDPILCLRGFHFCTNLISCFNYNSIYKDFKAAEVEALGQIVSDPNNDKLCTDKIKIVRELSRKEIMELTNLGIYNNGFCNQGYLNVGNYNLGTRNIGKHNCGNSNKGNHNVGSNNDGSYNKGRSNTGDYNIGHYNIGNNNMGDFNMTDNTIGCFCTKKTKLKMFNKPSNWTFQKWRASEQYFILECMMKNPRECRQKIWDALSPLSKKIVQNLPNFDPHIFEKVTGVKVDGGEQHE